MSKLTLPLTRGEAIIDAEVGVEAALAEAMRREGKPVPSPIPIKACLDTGAEGELLDISLVELLKLKCTGFTRVYSPGGGYRTSGLFGISLKILIPDGSNLLFNPIRAVAVAGLYNQLGFHALVGRDILRHLHFHFNGPAGEFSLEYPGQK